MAVGNLNTWLRQTNKHTHRLTGPAHSTRTAPIFWPCTSPCRTFEVAARLSLAGCDYKLANSAGQTNSLSRRLGRMVSGKGQLQVEASPTYLVACITQSVRKLINKNIDTWAFDRTCRQCPVPTYQLLGKSTRCCQVEVLSQVARFAPDSRSIPPILRLLCTVLQSCAFCRVCRERKYGSSNA